jgi:hypothetical protein
MKRQIKIIFMLLVLFYTNSLTAGSLIAPSGYYGYRTIVLSVKDLDGNNGDWIGIYPKGTSNDWANVKSWTYTNGTKSMNKNGIKNGTIELSGVKAGEYVARLFFNNSYTLEDKIPLVVLSGSPHIVASKNDFALGESIDINFENLPTNNGDWIGIYQKNSSDEWKNVILWSYTNGTYSMDDKGKSKGSLSFNSLEAGEYEARFFFKNSYNLGTKCSFSVEKEILDQPIIEMSKESYKSKEKIQVTLSNLEGNNDDWVGIYPKGSSNDWGNVVSWSFTNGTQSKDKEGVINGTLDLYGVKAGEYEARLFFNNSYNIEGKVSFIVTNTPEKYLLLSQKGSVAPSMATNFINNYEHIKQLPFSGFILSGDSHFTKNAMSGERLSYSDVWSAVQGDTLKNLYRNKANFLQVNVDFPGDFWTDTTAWNNTIYNFGIIAKVAKNLHFKGIVFDNEPYSQEAYKMIDFKGTYGWYDSDHPSYQNTNYSFKEHTDKLSDWFKKIMREMIKSYPDITVLVYHSPVISHEKADTGINGHSVIMNVGKSFIHELSGSMFVGLKRGLSGNASLHDMGEDYTHRQNKHFKDAYNWRKYTIALDNTNNLNADKRWILPNTDRANWSHKVNVNFMVSNYPLSNDVEEFDTRNKVSLNDMKSTLEKAIHYSDKYVVFYSEGDPAQNGVNKTLNWLNNRNQIDNNWYSMLEDIYGLDEIFK